MNNLPPPPNHHHNEGMNVLSLQVLSALCICPAQAPAYSDSLFLGVSFAPVWGFLKSRESVTS